MVAKARHSSPDQILRIEDNGEFLDAAYQRYAGRPADPEGKSYFLDRLVEETPREAVINALTSS